MKHNESDQGTTPPTSERTTKSLTDQILEDFHARLMVTGKIDESIADQLLIIARGQTKPKAKDIENLFKPKDIIE